MELSHLLSTILIAAMLETTPPAAGLSVCQLAAEVVVTAAAVIAAAVIAAAVIAAAVIAAGTTALRVEIAAGWIASD